MSHSLAANNNRSNGSSSQSVHSQLQTLSREAEAARRKKKRVDDEYDEVETQLKGLQTEDARLTEEIRKAQEMLGSFNGQRSSWEEERDHLNGQMERDRAALIVCAEEANGFETDKRKLNDDYCREMTDLNATQEDLNEAYDAKLLKSLLLPETVHVLQELWLEQNTDNHTLVSQETKYDEHHGLEELNFNESLACWKGASKKGDDSECVDFAESLAFWKGASKRRDDAESVNARLENIIGAFQKEVLASDNINLKVRCYCQFGVERPLSNFCLLFC